MNHPTEAELLADIQASIDIFARRERISTELPSAQIARKFDIGATLAVSMLADVSGQWIVSAAFNGTEFFAERPPEGEAHVAYEDDAIPLLKMFTTAIRDVAQGTCILGVAQPCGVDSLLSQTAIALAAIGPRLEQLRETPVTYPLAVAYEAMRDSVIALLDCTLHAFQEPWGAKVHSVHDMLAKEVMSQSSAADMYLHPAQ